MTAPVSIVIPAFNQLDYCRQCLQTLLMHTPQPYKLILVDNGSTDGVGEFFDAIPGATVLHAGKNLGFAGGVNLGMRHAEGHVLLLNSDTLLPRGWLERLLEALHAEPGIGMTGPMSNCVSGSQLIEGLEFASIENITAYADQLAQTKGNAVRDVARLVGFCLLIHEDAFRTVGFFDESYGVGNFEDDDYCLRTLRAGYRLCVAEGAFVFHYGSRTFMGMGLVDDEWKRLIARNATLFEEKWNATNEERSDAVQQSRQWTRRAREALESGRFHDALECYKNAIQAAPALEVNHNDLGVALWRLGDRKRAVICFKRALQYNPDYAEARQNLELAQQSSEDN